MAGCKYPVDFQEDQGILNDNELSKLSLIGAVE